MAQYYTLPTEIGQAKIANAIALETSITISQLAIGDGGGSLPVPDSDRTALVNEVRRAAINTSVVDPDNPNWIVVEQVLPPDIGGWTIREVGLYDADGDMIAYGNYPETYKPVLSEGSGRTQTIRFVMQVSDTAAVTLKVDPSVVLATREYVDAATLGHGLGTVTPGAPILDDFASSNKPTGFYRGWGAGTPSPTPNGPPGTGDSRLSVYALNVGGGMHWIVKENSAVNNTDHRLFFGNTQNGGVVWNQVFHGGNVGDATETARGFTRYATVQEHREGTRADRAAKPSGVKAAIDARIADQPTVDTGTDDTQFVTAKKLKVWAVGWVKQATETVAGMLKVATQAQVDAGTNDSTAITPKKMTWGFVASFGPTGYLGLPSWLGGFILQWGHYAGGAHSPTIGFPMVFPTDVYGVLPMAISNFNEIEYAHPSTPSPSSFVAACYRFTVGASPTISTANNVSFFWLAVGR